MDVLYIAVSASGGSGGSSSGGSSGGNGGSSGGSSGGSGGQAKPNTPMLMRWPDKTDIATGTTCYLVCLAQTTPGATVTYRYAGELVHSHVQVCRRIAP